MSFMCKCDLPLGSRVWVSLDLFERDERRRWYRAIWDGGVTSEWERRERGMEFEGPSDPLVVPQGPRMSDVYAYLKIKSLGIDCRPC